MRLRLVLGFVALLFMVSPCLAANGLPSGFREFPQNGWVFVARGSSVRPIQEHIAAIVDKELIRVQRYLGVKGKRPYRVVYCSGRSEFRSVTEELGGKTPSDWVVALAFPSRGIMLLDGSRLNPAHGTKETVAHELVHLVLGDSRISVPRWYHEGLAQWLSGKVVSPKDQSAVAGRAARDMMPSFETLDQFVSKTHVQSSLLYTQSHLFVSYLSRIHGEQIHRQILASVMRGGFQASFEKAVGHSLAVSEEGFEKYLRSQFSWFQWLWLNVGIFPPLAVLLILGFFVQRRIRRRKLDRMAAEEAILDAMEKGGESPH